MDCMDKFMVWLFGFLAVFMVTIVILVVVLQHLERTKAMENGLIQVYDPYSGKAVWGKHKEPGDAKADAE